MNFSKAGSVALVLVASSIFLGPPAQATTQFSETDSFTPNQPANYDLDYLTYQEFDTSPDIHFFGLFTKSSIVSNQFNDGLGSFGLVLLDENLDGVADYRIQTTETDLVSTFYNPAEVFIESTGEPLDCSAQFYSDIDNRVEWLAMTLDYSCLTLPSVFGIQAYLDYGGDDDRFFDYLPDGYGEFFIASHSFQNSDGSSATPASSVSTNPPSLGEQVNTEVSDPSQPPLALEKLSPEVLESVVTIFCGTGLGTGWVADVNLSQEHKNSGMSSFIVTNEHVIADCTGTRDVALVLSDGTRVSGKVVSWDIENDLAGIVTSANLEGLTWRGEKPAQGWWVGVLGAPRGISGYLTTGLISIVSSDLSELGTTSPVNPGNSGGPVFDREGRVIGTVSWKLLESEGLAFAKAAPLLCVQIVNCDSGDVWTSVESPSSEVENADNSDVSADSSARKLNAGSFKGYVALYAKGYKGDRFSAKVGKDWVIRPALEQDFVRIVEYTGPGYTINVRMYINSILEETITVTTK